MRLEREILTLRRTLNGDLSALGEAYLRVGQSAHRGEGPPLKVRKDEVGEVPLRLKENPQRANNVRMILKKW